MRRFLTLCSISALGLIVLLGAGCGARKAVRVESDPSGARIMVGVEYVGDAPVMVSLKEKGALTSEEDIVIRAEKSGYSPSTKVLSNKELPNRLFFTLDKAPAPSASSGAGQQQEQQQQISGPTIVIDGEKVK